MADLELTPAEVLELTGQAVNAADITSAAALILNETNWTVTQHVEDRDIDEDAVKMAWSIVAVRVHTQAWSTGSEGVTSETQGDYSVTTDLRVLSQYADDLLAGLPRQLLGYNTGWFTEVRPGSRMYSSGFVGAWNI